MFFGIFNNKNFKIDLINFFNENKKEGNKVSDYFPEVLVSPSLFIYKPQLKSSIRSIIYRISGIILFLYFIKTLVFSFSFFFIIPENILYKLVPLLKYFCFLIMFIFFIFICYHIIIGFLILSQSILKSKLIQNSINQKFYLSFLFICFYFFYLIYFGYLQLNLLKSFIFINKLMEPLWIDEVYPVKIFDLVVYTKNILYLNIYQKSCFRPLYDTLSFGIGNSYIFLKYPLCAFVPCSDIHVDKIILDEILYNYGNLNNFFLVFFFKIKFNLCDFYQSNFIY